MAIERLTFETKVIVRENLSAGEDGSDVDAVNVNRSQFNTLEQLTPDTDVPVSKYASGTLTIIAAATLNMADLINEPLSNKDMTGLKVQVVKFKSKSTNAADLTIQDGASNGYGMMGTTFSFTLKPGQELVFFGNNSTPDVATADRTLDLAVVGGGGTGTGTDNVVELEFCVGAG